MIRISSLLNKYSAVDTRNWKEIVNSGHVALKYFVLFDSLYNEFVQNDSNALIATDVPLLFESLHSMVHDEFQEDSMMFITSYLQFISRILKLSRAQSHPERLIGLVSITEPSITMIKTSSEIFKFLHQVLEISPIIAKFLCKYSSKRARYSTGFFYVAYLQDLSKFIISSIRHSDGNLLKLIHAFNLFTFIVCQR